MGCTAKQPGFSLRLLLWSRKCTISPLVVYMRHSLTICTICYWQTRIRAYARINYHGVYIRWLSVTLANAFDWTKYQRRPWQFSWLELLGICTRVCVRKSIRQKYKQCSVCSRTRAYTRVDGTSKYESTFIMLKRYRVSAGQWFKIII